MKALIFIVILLITAAGIGDVLAQSGRTGTKADGKLNRRQPQPAASPTPSPTPVETVANTPAPAEESDIITVNTQLVSIPVRVMDKKGRFIGGLTKESFKVFENGEEQEIALFSNEHQPFTVALVLDMSYSTTFKITEIQSAAIAFIAQLRPEDKVMVISFDGEVHMLCEATSDRKEIYRAIKSTKISDGTSLYEAVDLVMNDRMRHIEGRKAIILFTDGVDTTSHRSNDLENLRDAMELDSLIYTIRYDTFADVQNMKNGTGLPTQLPIPTSTPTSTGNPFPLPTIPVITTPNATPNPIGTTLEEYRRAQEYLDQMATRTGGRIYEASTLGNLGNAYSKIASELREFYSIGYYPKEDREAGKKANVKVKVNQAGLVVRSREGFIRRKVKK